MAGTVSGTLQELKPKVLCGMLDGLERIPEGRAWLTKNENFLLAAKQAVREKSFQSRHSNRIEAEQAADILSLSNRLEELLPSTSGMALTNSPGEASAP